MRRGTTILHAGVMAALTLTGTVGCRPDPGVPEYRSPEDFSPEALAPVEPAEGTNPYVPGEPRLAIGAFYEGGSSEQVIIDDETTHFYIYGLEGDGTPTFTIAADTSVVEEGLQSDRVTHAGTPWWGGGIQWDNSRDLSEWTSLSLSLRSEASSFASVEIHVVGEAEGIVQATDYGYVNDGQWHHITIPLADFTDVDLSAVTAPLVFIGTGGEQGDRLWVDNVYYAQD